VKGKLKLILPILVVLALAGGAAYKFVLAKPAKAAAVKPKVDGSLFALSPEFVVNLSDNHYGKVTIALLLKQAPTAKDLSAMATTPTLTEDPMVRSVITNDLTGAATSDLIARAQRNALRTKILHDLQASTDVGVTGVLFTDVVVQ
jgi:flagellar basal body-associated protein FliL